MQQQPEQFTTEIVQHATGVQVRAQRRNEWNFPNKRGAENYFQHQYRRFTALKWGLHALEVGAIVNVGFGIEKAIETNSIPLGIGAAFTGGLILIVREFNVRSVETHRRLSKEMRDQVARQLAESGDTE